MDEEYTVEHGIIKDPGRFQGEPEWAPSIYQQCLEGGAEHDFSAASDAIVDATYFVKVDEKDRERFSDLKNTYGVSLHSDDQGFVSANAYETQAEYDQAVESERKRLCAVDRDEMGSIGLG